MLAPLSAASATHNCIEQSSTAEKTTGQKLNQGVCTDVLYYHPCLTFLLLFVSRQKVKKKLMKKHLIWLIENKY